MKVQYWFLLFAPLSCDNISKEGPPQTAVAAPVPQATDTRTVEGAKAVASAGAERITAAKGSPNCEQAFTELEALVTTARAVPGNRANPKSPNKKLFLETCGAAPEVMQRCAIFSHAMQHAAQCKAGEAKMDPAPLLKLKKMMKGALVKGT